MSPQPRPNKRQTEAVLALAKSPLVQDLARSAVLTQMADLRSLLAKSAVLPMLRIPRRQLAASQAVFGLAQFQRQLVSSGVISQLAQIQRQVVKSNLLPIVVEAQRQFVASGALRGVVLAQQQMATSLALKHACVIEEQLLPLVKVGLIANQRVAGQLDTSPIVNAFRSAAASLADAEVTWEDIHATAEEDLSELEDAEDPERWNVAPKLRPALVALLALGIAVAVCVNAINAMNDEAASRGLNAILGQLALILAILTATGFIRPPDK